MKVMMSYEFTSLLFNHSRSIQLLYIMSCRIVPELTVFRFEEIRSSSCSVHPVCALSSYFSAKLVHSAMDKLGNN